MGWFRGAVVGKILVWLIATQSSSVLAEEWIYTTRPGDNLWDLSQEYLSSMDYWRPLQELNNITEPRKMPPGTRLRFPLAWLKAQPVGVRVVQVGGDVTASTGPQGRHGAVQVDALLHANDEILTGEDGSVTLEFADGSRLLLQANSHLKLDIVRAHKNTGMVDSRVRLEGGRLESTVNPLKAPNNRFEIHTPGAVSAVRGTVLRVASDSGTQTSSAEVLSGRVEVMAAGESQMLNAGFGTVVKEGEAPQVPVALLQAPSLAGIPLQVFEMPVQFVWPELAGAERYRIQLSVDDEFASLLMDISSSEAQFSQALLRDGEYALRVRGVNTIGLEGFDAIHRFTVDTEADPPQLIKPAPAATLRGEIEQFHWSETRPKDRYRLQVDDDADFSSPVVDVQGYRGTRFKLSADPPAGQYYWRVATAHQTGPYGAFSDAHAFSILALPAAPTLETPEQKDQQWLLRWQGSGEPRFQYDVAADASFSELVSNAEVAEPQVRLESLTPGRYYLRVKAIDDEGYAGPYSVQAFDVPDQ